MDCRDQAVAARRGIASHFEANPPSPLSGLSALVGHSPEVARNASSDKGAQNDAQELRSGPFFKFSENVGQRYALSSDCT